MVYEFRVIGDSAILCNGTPVGPLPPRAAALLAYLSWQPEQWITRRSLVALLWPGRDPGRARHSLSQLLYQVEQRLPGLSIARDRDGLKCPAALSLDAFVLVRPASTAPVADGLLALAHISLAECILPESISYREWWDSIRASVEGRARSLLHAKAAEECRRGNFAKALKATRLLLSVGDFRQDTVSIHVGAVRVLEGHPAAEAEYRRLSEDAQDVGVVLNPPASLSLADQQGVLTDDHGGVLIGRHAEFHSLRGILESSVGGLPRLAAVIGEAGIGKTRLLNQLERLATIRGIRVFGGKAHSAEQYLSYSTITDALSRNISDAELDALPASWGNLLAQVLPRSVTDTSVLRSHSAELLRRQIVEAFAAFFESASRRQPLLVLLDDFQWADQSTVEVVSYLRRRLPTSRICIVLGVRPEDLVGNAPAQELVYDRTSNHVLVQVGPLAAGSSAELFTAFASRLNVAIDEQSRQAVLAQSGGRPFFILEAIRHLEQQNASIAYHFDDYKRARPVLITQTIDDYVATRLRRLHQEHAAVVTAIAVLGRYAKLGTLEAVLATNGLTVATMLADLERRGLVICAGDRLQFTHDILSDAAYRLSPGTARRLLHARSARVLEASRSAPSAILAIHYDLAGLDGDAFRHALIAAKAEEAGYGEWEFFWQLALRTAGSPDEVATAREGLLKSLLAHRRYEEALPHAEALLPQYENSGNEFGSLLATNARLGYEMERGTLDAAEALRRFADAAEAALRVGQVDYWIESGTYLLASAHDAGNTELVRKWSASMLEVVTEDLSSRARVRLYSLIGRLYAMYGDVSEGMKLTTLALECAKESDAASRATALRAHGVVYYFGAQLDEAEAYLCQAKEIAQSECSQIFVDRVDNDLAVMDLERGRYRQVVERVSRLISADVNHDTLFIAGNLAIANYELGQYAACNDAAELMLRINETVNAAWARYSAYGFLGLAALAVGDIEQAETAYGIVASYSALPDPVVVGDDRYIHIFAARYVENREGPDRALETLRRVVEVSAVRDRLATLRLQLEMARLLTFTDSDAGWRLARQVLAESRSRGALALERIASDLIDSIDG